MMTTTSWMTNIGVLQIMHTNIILLSIMIDVYDFKW